MNNLDWNNLLEVNKIITSDQTERHLNLVVIAKSRQAQKVRGEGEPYLHKFKEDNPVVFFNKADDEWVKGGTKGKWVYFNPTTIRTEKVYRATVKLHKGNFVKYSTRLPSKSGESWEATPNLELPTITEITDSWVIEQTDKRIKIKLLMQDTRSFLWSTTFNLEKNAESESGLNLIQKADPIYKPEPQPRNNFVLTGTQTKGIDKERKEIRLYPASRHLLVYRHENGEDWELRREDQDCSININSPIDGYIIINYRPEFESVMWASSPHDFDQDYKTVIERVRWIRQEHKEGRAQLAHSFTKSYQQKHTKEQNIPEPAKLQMMVYELNGLYYQHLRDDGNVRTLSCHATFNRVQAEPGPSIWAVRWSVATKTEHWVTEEGFDKYKIHYIPDIHSFDSSDSAIQHMEWKDINKWLDLLHTEGNVYYREVVNNDTGGGVTDHSGRKYQNYYPLPMNLEIKDSGYREKASPTPTPDPKKVALDRQKEKWSDEWKQQIMKNRMEEHKDRVKEHVQKRREEMFKFQNHCNNKVG